ncbi:MAG: undecaprenyl-phosphate alpha-N-acetylglucosaminyl 1-phosphate transferase [Flavobacteriales bacterium]|nr:MAG: undecaprenyl-phosphate alpha-N-acetylglucosaminyl 1-phosphate transferase [Flavobacteriales bacterium]
MEGLEFGKGIIVVVLGFITSFIIVLLSVPALIKVAHMKNLTDEPDDERKLHAKNIPSIGGIVIFAGTLFSYFLWYPFSSITEAEDYSELLRITNDFKYIGAAMLILFFVGVKDDIIGTAPVKKLAGHLIVSFILVLMADLRITSFNGLFGIYDIPYWASIFLSLFTYTVIVNAFNLIDGVDGLAAGIGFIVCMAFGTWFYLVGGIELSVLAFVLGGSLLGFLVFNFSPAKIFMGDSGSLTIGLIVSILSIKLIEFDKIENIPEELIMISKPVFVMACLAYPLIDTLRIFIYRAVTGHSPFGADRNHIHHRLIDIGLNHRQTVLILYSLSVFIIYLALTVNTEPSNAFLIVGCTAAALAQVPFLFKKRKNIDAKMKPISKKVEELKEEQKIAN